MIDKHNNIMYWWETVMDCLRRFYDEGSSDVDWLAVVTEMKDSVDEVMGKGWAINNVKLVLSEYPVPVVVFG